MDQIWSCILQSFSIAVKLYYKTRIYLRKVLIEKRKQLHFALENLALKNNSDIDMINNLFSLNTLMKNAFH